MKFMILGAGSGLPHTDYHLSSILVQTQKGNYLVDCGEGTSKQLLRQGYPNDFIDAVFISHYHPDHISGIYMLIQMLYLNGRTKPLQLFLPERTDAFLETMHLFYTFEQRLPFVLNIHEVNEIESFFSDVTGTLTDHLRGYKELIQSQNYKNPMHSYCFTFSEVGKSLVYTSDISTFTNIQHIMENSDTLIVDAIHPKAELLISMNDFAVPRIILTHGISDELNSWLIDNPQSRFERAKENEMYQL